MRPSSRFRQKFLFLMTSFDSRSLFKEKRKPFDYCITHQVFSFLTISLRIECPCEYIPLCLEVWSNSSSKLPSCSSYSITHFHASTAWRWKGFPSEGRESLASEVTCYVRTFFIQWNHSFILSSSCSSFIFCVRSACLTSSFVSLILHFKTIILFLLPDFIHD